jgi:hypothetical protein
MKLSKLSALVLLGIGAGAVLGAAVAAPEIDAGAGMNALALAAGALLIIRGRRK